jgi:hypothetical protein
VLVVADIAVVVGDAAHRAQHRQAARGQKPRDQRRHRQQEDDIDDIVGEGAARGRRRRPWR